MTKDEINEYPYLANYFKENPKKVDEFIEYAEIGKQMGRLKVLHHLINIYNDYYGKWKFTEVQMNGYTMNQIESGIENLRFICIPYTMILAVYTVLEEESTEFPKDVPFEEAMNCFNTAAGRNFDDKWERTYIFDSISQIDFPSIAMEVINNYLYNRKKCAALCFGLWENIGFDDGFMYRKENKSKTGLPVDIFLDDSSVWAAKECWNRPIFKFKPYKSDKRYNYNLIPMSVDANPEILFKNPKMELTEAEVEKIKQYVIKNKNSLLELYITQ